MAEALIGAHSPPSLRPQQKVRSPSRELPSGIGQCKALDAMTSSWQERRQRDAGVGSPLVAVGSLSARERSILERIGRGKSNKEIAKDLCIAPETVKSHVKNIFVKLAVNKRAQAVARAQSLGLVDAPF